MTPDLIEKRVKIFYITTISICSLEALMTMIFVGMNPGTSGV
jgi:hypothetical protein